VSAEGVNAHCPRRAPRAARPARPDDHSPRTGLARPAEKKQPVLGRFFLFFCFRLDSAQRIVCAVRTRVPARLSQLPGSAAYLACSAFADTPDHALMTTPRCPLVLPGLSPTTTINEQNSKGGVAVTALG
jgi:hypothetical protein